jgi:hypothetical protein
MSISVFIVRRSCFRVRLLRAQCPPLGQESPRFAMPSQRHPEQIDDPKYAQPSFSAPHRTNRLRSHQTPKTPLSPRPSRNANMRPSNSLRQTITANPADFPEFDPLSSFFRTGRREMPRDLQRVARLSAFGFPLFDLSSSDRSAGSRGSRSAARGAR